MRGSILPAGILFLLAMISVSVLAANASLRYIVLQQNQRTSDLAVLAAASMPQAVEHGKPSATAQAAATQIAALNGVPATDLSLSAEAIDGQPDQAALKATISQTSVPGGRALSADAWATVFTAPVGDCLVTVHRYIDIYLNAHLEGPRCNARSGSYLTLSGPWAVFRMREVSVAVSEAIERVSLLLADPRNYTPAASAFRYGVPSEDRVAASAPVRAMRAHLDSMAWGWPYGVLSPLRPPLRGIAQDSISVIGGQRSIPPGGFANLEMDGGELDIQGAGAPDPTCAKPTTFYKVSFKGANSLRLTAGCYVFEVMPIWLGKGAELNMVTPGPGQVTLVFNGGSLTLEQGATLKVGDATTYFNGGSIVTGQNANLSFGDGAFNLWGGSILNGAGSWFNVGSGPFHFFGGTLINWGSLRLGDGPFEFLGGSMGLYGDSVTEFGVGDINFYGGSVTAAGDRWVIGAGGNRERGAARVAFSGGTFSLVAGNLIARGVSWGFAGGTVNLNGRGRIEATAPSVAAPDHGDRNLLWAIWGGAFNMVPMSGSSALMSGAVYLSEYNHAHIGLKSNVSYPEGGCFSVFSGGSMLITDGASLQLAPCLGISAAAQPGGGSGVRLWQ